MADSLDAPFLRTAPPGPVARELSERLRAAEAPGINTLYGGAPNIVWREAFGTTVVDVDGNRYLDLTAGFGVASIGHRHPRVVEAVRAQAGRLLHGLGDAAAHPGRIELAERLARLAPRRDSAPEAIQIHFAVSGSDAVEIALKTALLTRPGRRRIVAFEPSYHGLTLGALAATSRPAFRDPFAHHLHHHVHRAPYGGALDPLDQTLARGDVAAVLVEPIVGREGVLIPPPGWLARLSETCRRHDVLLIADEIFTGLGRVGRLWACDLDGVVPDLLCCGKALGGGLPIAAVAGPADLLRAWSTPGEALHTGTFVAHPLACAAALAALDVLEGENLVERSARLGGRIAPRLAEWPRRFDAVRETRGRSLLWGVEMVDARAASDLALEARRRGVLLLAGGPEGRVAQIVPALTIADAALDEALERLEEVLGRLESPVLGSPASDPGPRTTSHGLR